MSARAEYRIEEPRVGMVLEENDPRGSLIRRIVDLDDSYAYCRSGIDGRGRRSRVKIDRLRAGHYRVVAERDARPSDVGCGGDGT